jgi:Flp pilus assembly protein TadG
MRIMRKHFRRLFHDERGANAVLIALLIVPLMGVGALALDISAQHAERTQLQLGADAAALAVAASCAEAEATCASTAEATANGLITANGGPLVPGAADAVEFDFGARTVEVTAAADFPHFLASLIDGDDDPGSTTVSTSAIATWGTPDDGSTIPLAVSECELDRHFDTDTE